MIKLLSLLLPLFLFSCRQEPNNETAKITPKNYSAFIEEARDYCKNQNLNTSWFILADYSLHSGKKRFFVFDLVQNTFTDTFLVAHGCGNNPWQSENTKENPQFSNENNSHCSSEGKYVIGERGASIFGVKIKYLLYGKDNTNNNAIKRDIVFHSWEMVSDEEVYPRGTPEGWGCPAISNKAFVKLDKMLQSTTAGTLLWVIK